MPTVFRAKGFRFYFVSHDCREPVHIHMDRGAESAKFWLEPTRLARNQGFGGPELRAIEALLKEHHQLCLEAWHEHCGKAS
jgi:Domain of unknown function (DUF4160)